MSKCSFNALPSLHENESRWGARIFRRKWWTIQNCEWRRKKQITFLRGESQWIVAQRPLSHLQYPDTSGSSIQNFPFAYCARNSTLNPLIGIQVYVDVGTIPLWVFLLTRERDYHCFSTDPRLEAFSCIPTDDSIAILVLPLVAFTRYLNELFLSY